MKVRFLYFSVFIFIIRNVIIVCLEYLRELVKRLLEFIEVDKMVNY